MTRSLLSSSRRALLMCERCFCTSFASWVGVQEPLERNDKILSLVSLEITKFKLSTVIIAEGDTNGKF